MEEQFSDEFFPVLLFNPSPEDRGGEMLMLEVDSSAAAIVDSHGDPVISQAVPRFSMREGELHRYDNLSTLYFRAPQLCGYCAATLFVRLVFEEEECDPPFCSEPSIEAFLTSSNYAEDKATF